MENKICIKVSFLNKTKETIEWKVMKTKFILIPTKTCNNSQKTVLSRSALVWVGPPVRSDILSRELRWESVSHLAGQAFN